ncbi:MAG: hypothetical protein V3R80_00240, partial [Candidatus Tectomicrobia bacterium]
GRRDRALLATLASSGCRVSEVVTLTTAQIIPRAGHFVLQIVGKNDLTACTWPHESGHIWEAVSPHPSRHEVGLKPLAPQSLQYA